MPAENTPGALPDSPAKPVPGDGVATIPIDSPAQESRSMNPIDLPPNVAAQLQLESMQNGQITTNQGRQISQMATGVLQAAMARNFDKIGTEEARAVSGINATPIAGPATKQV